MKTIDRIKKYYENSKLKILDNGEPHGIYTKIEYMAVSLDYIHKYLLKEKVTKKFTAKVLFKLCKEKIIFPVPCTYANNLVFCKYKFQVDKWFLKYKVGETKIEEGSDINFIDDKTYLSNFNKFLN